MFIVIVIVLIDALRVVWLFCFIMLFDWFDIVFTCCLLDTSGMLGCLLWFIDYCAFVVGLFVIDGWVDFNSVDLISFFFYFDFLFLFGWFSWFANCYRFTVYLIVFVMI